MTRNLILPALLLTAALGGCLDDTSGTLLCDRPKVAIPTLSGDTVTTTTGLKYIVRTEGTGTAAQVGSTVQVDYTLYLADGTQIESTVGRNPATFVIDETLIPGFREGVVGMNAGGSRRLIIPSTLAYGSVGSGRCIKPNDTLIFDVDLKAVG